MRLQMKLEDQFSRISIKAGLFLFGAVYLHSWCSRRSVTRPDSERFGWLPGY